MKCAAICVAMEFVIVWPCMQAHCPLLGGARLHSLTLNSLSCPTCSSAGHCHSHGQRQLISCPGHFAAWITSPRSKHYLSWHLPAGG